MQYLMKFLILLSSFIAVSGCAQEENDGSTEKSVSSKSSGEFDAKNAEKNLIEAAKSRMLDKLLEKGIIQSRNDISFFDDCCSIRKAPSENAIDQIIGEEYRYSVGVTHFKYDQTGHVNKYSYSSMVSKYGDIVGEAVSISENQNDFVSNFHKKFGKKINVQEFQN